MFKLSILVLSLALISRCNYPCQKNQINPVFIGFSQSDIDTFVIRAYQPNTNFQNLLDTFLVIDKYANVYTNSNDSTTVYINSGNPNHWISAGFDWQIFIPAKNKTISITNIVSPEKDGSKGCINPIESFEQEGQFIKATLVNTGQFYTSGYMLYIRN